MKYGSKKADICIEGDMGKALSTKLKILNKHEMQNLNGFEHSDFGFVLDFDVRISGLQVKGGK